MLAQNRNELYTPKDGNIPDLNAMQGKITVINGRLGMIGRVCMSSAMKLQDVSNVLFVDSGDVYSPLFIDRFSYLNPKAKSENIFVSRPANAYKLKDSLKDLDKQLQHQPVKVLIVSSINSLFLEDCVRDRQLPYLFAKVIKELRKLTQKYNLITIVGNSETLDRKRLLIMNKLLQEKVDHIYNV